FAIKTHDVYQKQKRKGKDIAYITHPLTVALILSQANAPEDLIIAGILHDTIEDSVPQKKVTRAMLTERFGRRVADLVVSVTESSKSKTWEVRKRVARRHITKFSHDSILVKSADVIANVRELMDDYLRDGDQVFDRFHAEKEHVIANYGAVIALLLKRWPGSPLANDLRQLLKDYSSFA
ncbi:MAG: bifunctional (p)ppGpp synthetase/guanosine-3',5'-bis(diphosphate) 3'-pyrophosphohydrolase, partial [Candidatus Kerfeldbacteria bacterium]|nr:bifunctional (p)ppGpp synthetase/guanosine-3',5'-bis(diphosphate) 3'-pyrophosphohydrolase [Candidatus Kerfeldbacteria bacterium]